MLVSHHGGPGSNTEQFMWDLLWKIWHCDRYFPKHFAGFPLSVSFHQYSISFTIVCIARSNWRSSQFMYITISPTRVNLESSFSTWYYYFVKISSNESISTCRGLQPTAASSTSSKFFSQHPVLKWPLYVLSLELVTNFHTHTKQHVQLQICISQFSHF